MCAKEVQGAETRVGAEHMQNCPCSMALVSKEGGHEQTYSMKVLRTLTALHSGSSPVVEAILRKE